MSELAQFIRIYGPEKLAKDLEANQDFKIFNLLWNEPRHIIPLVERMGWQTVNDVVEWVNNVNKAFDYPERIDAFCNQIAPKVSVNANLQPLVAPELISTAIRKTGLVNERCEIILQDSNYRLLTLAQITETAQKFQIQQRTYVSDVMDCDDFTRMYRGFLSSHGLGNASIGEVVPYYYKPNSQQAFVAHAMAIAVDTDTNVWLIEPQNGVVFSPVSEIAKRMNGLEYDRFDFFRIVF